LIASSLTALVAGLSKDHTALVAQLLGAAGVTRIESPTCRKMTATRFSGQCLPFQDVHCFVAAEVARLEAAINCLECGTDAEAGTLATPSDSDAPSAEYIPDFEASDFAAAVTVR